MEDSREEESLPNNPRVTDAGGWLDRVMPDRVTIGTKDEK